MVLWVGMAVKAGQALSSMADKQPAHNQVFSQPNTNWISQPTESGLKYSFCQFFKFLVFDTALQTQTPDWAGSCTSVGNEKWQEEKRGRQWTGKQAPLAVRITLFPSFWFIICLILLFPCFFLPWKCRQSAPRLVGDGWRHALNALGIDERKCCYHIIIISSENLHLEAG